MRFVKKLIRNPIGSIKKIIKLVLWLPKWLPDEYSSYIVLRRRLENWVMQLVTKERFETVSFADEEWDNLVIMDACRYDTMAANSIFEEKVEPRFSNASHTHEFLEKNFSGSHLDTVYITASPQVAQFGGKFAHVEHVWKDKWSEEHNTVLPEDVTDTALEMKEKFPDKKLIVHYMQPHFPFIKSQIEQGSYRGKDRGRKLPSVWEKLYAGEVNIDEVKRDYENNLKLALPEVKRLVEDLRGKTIITSDHGNLFGKKISCLPIRTYGHPIRVKDPELNRVPWIEISAEKRKEIAEAEERHEEKVDEKEVKKKLQDLGYGS